MNGAWRLAPAYDLLPSSGFNGYHTTTINGQGEPTLQDILVVAKEVSITAPDTKSTIDELTQICNSKGMLKYKLK